MQLASETNANSTLPKLPTSRKALAYDADSALQQAMLQESYVFAITARAHHKYLEGSLMRM